VNILIKRAMLVAGISTAMALPLSSQASDGTITFTGAVTANTCTVVVNGTTADATVALPTVSTAALTNAAASGATAAKTTAAGTFFNMTVSGCAAAVNDFNAVHTPSTVQIYFEAGPNVDVITGGLINTLTGPSPQTHSNVEVNLYNASSASIVTTQIMPGTNTNQPGTQSLATLATTPGTQYFYAGYSTAGTNGLAGAAATAGAVSTSVTYSLIYQ
jgi:major type 1 subunit fimbrin (pilin)